MSLAICSGLMFFICSAMARACSSDRFSPADLDMAASVSGLMSFIISDTICAQEQQRRRRWRGHE